MCNHYEKNVEVVEMAVQLMGESGWVVDEHGDVVAPADLHALPPHTWPKQQAPIITQTEDGRAINLARWGVRVEIKTPRGPAVKFVTNSRDDKLTGFTWRYCIAERRCLIPAVAYYEPEGPEGAKWEVRYTVNGRSSFYIAGVWDLDPDGVTRSFSMVTTEPNALAARIKDRMPLVLDDDCVKAWLGHTPLSPGTLRDLCRPFPAERMTSQAMPPPEKVGKQKIGKGNLSPAQGELFL